MMMARLENLPLPTFEQISKMADREYAQGASRYALMSRLGDRLVEEWANHGVLLGTEDATDYLTQVVLNAKERA